MKYIIEIAKEYEEYFKGILICGIAEGKFAVDVIAKEDLEELNSDYINEHYGDLQDTAYQRGLDDAWEAARKIADMWTRIDNDELLETFGVTAKIGESVIETLFKKQTANEAMLELEAYEEKQKAEDEIKVGDEVISLRKNGEVLEDMSPWIVTYETKYAYQGFDACGMFHNNPKERVRKTGRHFDIASTLKEMQS